jgi:serine/threonine protein kinase
VLVALDGSLRIIDFAQALMVHAPGDTAGEARVSQKHGPPGKPRYRGPELASGAPYLATKVDAFAVGVMLYALLVGKYPFMPDSACSDDPTRVDLFPAEEAASGRCTRLHLQLEKANKDIVDQISPGCLDMMEQLLAPNPELRLSVEEAYMHPWITGAVSGLWPPADDEDISTTEDSIDDVSTIYTGDSDMMADSCDNISVSD